MKALIVRDQDKGQQGSGQGAGQGSRQDSKGGSNQGSKNNINRSLNESTYKEFVEMQVLKNQESIAKETGNKL